MYYATFFKLINREKKKQYMYLYLHNMYDVRTARVKKFDTVFDGMAATKNGACAIGDKDFI